MVAADPGRFRGVTATPYGGCRARTLSNCTATARDVQSRIGCHVAQLDVGLAPSDGVGGSTGRTISVPLDSWARLAIVTGGSAK